MKLVWKYAYFSNIITTIKRITDITTITGITDITMIADITKIYTSIIDY